MNIAIEPVYYDRRDGRIKRERVHAARFLDWSSNSWPGRLAADFIFSRRWFSAVYGWALRQRWSRRKIRPFVRDHEIDQGELVQSLADFSSFRDFFIRRINPAMRPAAVYPGACLAPADGRALVYQVLLREKTFQIKRNLFNLDRFLGSATLAERFAGGSMAVIRLPFSGYHHFHFPDSGVPGTPVLIPGKYHAGGSYSLRRKTPFFTENRRMITPFDSDHFGPMAIVEVGAMTVGSIRQCFRAGERAARGERKGYFEPGGSTVVLLFERNRVIFDYDLWINTRRVLETSVRVGESIGQIPMMLSRRLPSPGGDPQ
jgi:phosphatidylserine decarboxylase